ncbi:nuclear transport factor 2 family protein [Allosphingosinicella indica]|uniref:Limonene-1,2-epoxide hydrolase n=1 Tax=Allosphingosinicella indica TaxID=941907 RepID=A0A1X7G0N6_9SPHN|nr:limonene-1,2-epoxide hydrolase family protein [Allosphingosinicella indica]SMF61911.1 limonene-1,2-epoxide hydrolase [Allosphingosinicella indica]
MSDAEKIALVEAQIAAWNRKDWEAAAAMFAEDAILHSVMVEPIHGRDAIHQRISGLGAGASEINLQIKNIGVVNGKVFAERVDGFVYQGKTGAVPVVGVLDIDDGKIKVWTEYYDRNQLLSEMGLTKDFDHETR